MSFDATLRQIVDGCRGCMGAVLMGYDGVAIAQVGAGAAPDAALLEDVATAGIEFARILSEIRKTSHAVAGGPLHETSVVLARFALVFGSVDDDTFLLVALDPNANLGKARYLMRRHMLAVRQEL
jgi:predicted regulator of Ras-like GTPase activity (Roadblock/LC7/MglB family)